LESFATVVFILVVGVAIASLSGEATWLNRFGALTVVLALILAALNSHSNQLHQQLCDRIRSFKMETQSGNPSDEIFDEIEGVRSYKLSLASNLFAIIWRDKRYSALYSRGSMNVMFPADHSDNSVIFPFDQLDAFQQQAEEITAVDAKNRINKELRYAAIGTLFWAFGDLVFFWL
jgi:hypothetical protein